MSEVKNIVFVGVGGQGIILASRLLTEGLVKAGYDVKMSEVHGMAQRGGSVSTTVRYGKKVFSPIIGDGQADILVSFESMEAVRWAHMLKPTGKVVVNNHEIPSIVIASGQAQYPEGMIEALKKAFDTTVIDAVRLGEELGNAKTQNVVLFGALVKAMDIGDIDWKQIIKEIVPEKMVEINQKAYEAGYNA